MLKWSNQLASEVDDAASRRVFLLDENTQHALRQYEKTQRTAAMISVDLQDE